MLSYGIIFPVYNEERRIIRGIEKAYSYISTLGIEFEFLIVDNASTDETEKLAGNLCKQFEDVHYLRIAEKGVGAAFRSGVKELKTDIVGYMDIDLATDIRCFSKVVFCFEKYVEVALLNGSRFNRKSMIIGRKWYRNIISYGLIFLLKVIFRMRATDAICGFKFFRRNMVLSLISEASDENGWFYIIELLIRAEKKRVKIVELPVCWADDAKNSKVNVIDTVLNYIVQILKLRKALRKETNG